MPDRPLRLAGCALAATMASGVALADISASREGELMTLLRHDCGACHGLTLRGGLGPPLLPGRLAPWSEDALAAAILDGVPGTPMPPWSPEIAPEEAAWLARMLMDGVPDGN